MIILIETSINNFSKRCPSCFFNSCTDLALQGWYFYSLRWKMSKLKAISWVAVWRFSCACEIVSSWSFSEISGRHIFGKSLTHSLFSDSHKNRPIHDGLTETSGYFVVNKFATSFWLRIFSPYRIIVEIFCRFLNLCISEYSRNLLAIKFVKINCFSSL